MPDIKGIWVGKDMIDDILKALRSLDNADRREALHVAHGHRKAPPSMSRKLAVSGAMSDEARAVIQAYVKTDGSLRDKPE